MTWYQRLNSLTVFLEICYGSSLQKLSSKVSFVKIRSVTVMLKGIKDLCLRFRCFFTDLGEIQYRKYQHNPAG
jgi:hypothetical protein